MYDAIGSDEGYGINDATLQDNIIVVYIVVYKIGVFGVSWFLHRHVGVIPNIIMMFPSGKVLLITENWSID